MGTFLKQTFALRWQPGRDTAVALLTALAMIPVYYLGAHGTTAGLGLVVFTILGNGLLNVLFPAYYLLVVRREPPAELGITAHRLGLAVMLAIFWGTLAWFGLQKEALRHPETPLLPHLLFNGLILWEPFFVYGWLQLRFERAFGVLPGLVLAALAFGAYHLGSYPLPGIVMLVVIGLFYGVIFRVARNLLAVWPLVWSMSSSIGTLQGGFSFGWSEVGTYALLLVVQLAAITWMIRRQQS